MQDFIVMPTHTFTTITAYIILTYVSNNSRAIYRGHTLMVLSHQRKTTTRQRQDKSWTCAFLLCLSHQVCRTWCERHNRNAQVQHLSRRCLALVWKHHDTSRSKFHDLFVNSKDLCHKLKDLITLRKCPKLVTERPDEIWKLKKEFFK